MPRGELTAAEELVGGVAMEGMHVDELGAEDAPLALGTADVNFGLFTTTDELIRFHRYGLSGKQRRV